MTGKISIGRAPSRKDGDWVNLVTRMVRDDGGPFLHSVDHLFFVDCETLLAFCDDSLAGLISFSIRQRRRSAPEVRVHAIFVRQDRRRAGVGRALLQAVKTEAHDAGAHFIDLHVHPFNFAMLKLAQSLGAGGNLAPLYIGVGQDE